MSRSDGASEMSRHLAEPAGVDVLVHFAQDVVEPARSDIALHSLNAHAWMMD